MIGGNMAEYKLAKNGITDYVIILPEERDTFVDFALKTLVEVIEKSTGAKLEVAKTAKGKFVSLGNTEALKALNPEIKYGKDGYAVIEKEGNLYLFGEGIYGAIWAVYGLLEEKVGYRFFTPDEIKIEKREEIDITGLDLFYTPTFPNRCSGFGLAKYDLEYATGLKAYAWYGQRLDGKFFWGAWAHNQVNKYMPPKKYYKDHPEWYHQMERFYSPDPEKMIPDKMQLCYSNMEMREEFTKNLIEDIKKNTHATHFMLGHEDNPEYCTCENCKKLAEELTQPGLHMDFINDIARRVEKWRVENCPEREILIGGFAYEPGLSFEPPVKLENGEYVPIDPRVKAEPNVFIFFCPIAAPEHSRSVYAEVNKNIIHVMNKWKTICSRFGIQTYYGSFRRAYEFVDGIYRYKGDIEFYKSVGVESFYMEAPSYPGSIAFQAMSLYVLTRLEWDKTLDTDELIEEFCTNYYKAAAPAMLKYFRYMMAHFEKVRKRTPYLTGKEFTYGMCLTDTIPQLFWDMNTIYDASVILDEAEESVRAGGYDEAMCEKLLDRIEKERMTVLLVQLEYFNKEISQYDEARSVNAYPKEKIFELCDRFERNAKKFGYNHVCGDYKVDEALKIWRERAEKSARWWQERTDRLNKKFSEEWGR